MVEFSSSSGSRSKLAEPVLGEDAILASGVSRESAVPHEAPPDELLTLGTSHQGPLRSRPACCGRESLGSSGFAEWS
jgi:hypothetical protein